MQSFMYQLIKGTAHCHKHGVMHRDLKPQNLLVDDDTECLKIADLGLGRAFSIPIKSYTHEARLSNFSTLCTFQLVIMPRVHGHEFICSASAAAAGKIILTVHHRCSDCSCHADCDPMVQSARGVAGLHSLHSCSGHVECGLHLCRDGSQGIPLDCRQFANYATCMHQAGLISKQTLLL